MGREDEDAVVVMEGSDMTGGADHMGGLLDVWLMVWLASGVLEAMQRKL